MCFFLRPVVKYKAFQAFPAFYKQHYLTSINWSMGKMARKGI